MEGCPREAEKGVVCGNVGRLDLGLGSDVLEELVHDGCRPRLEPAQELQNTLATVEGVRDGSSDVSVSIYFPWKLESVFTALEFVDDLNPDSQIGLRINLQPFTRGSLYPQNLDTFLVCTLDSVDSDYPSIESYFYSIA